MVCQIGVGTSGSPSAYSQLLAAVYRMLWVAVRIACIEVADLSVMWLVMSVVASITSVPPRIARSACM